MAELYWGPTFDFIEQATRNRIVQTLRKAYFDYYGSNVSESEERSGRVEPQVSQTTVRATVHDLKGRGAVVSTARGASTAV